MTLLKVKFWGLDMWSAQLCGLYLKPWYLTWLFLVSKWHLCCLTKYCPLLTYLATSQGTIWFKLTNSSQTWYYDFDWRTLFLQSPTSMARLTSHCLIKAQPAYLYITRTKGLNTSLTSQTHLSCRFFALCCAAQFLANTINIPCSFPNLEPSDGKVLTLRSGRWLAKSGNVPPWRKLTKTDKWTEL